MSQSLPVRSVSAPLRPLLREGALAGRVLGWFARACLLLADSGQVVALVWGGNGNGPLNVVLEAPPAALNTGERFCLSFDLSGAAMWSPWPTTNSSRMHESSGRNALFVHSWERFVIGHAATDLRALLAGRPTGVDPHDAADVVAAHRAGNRPALAAAVRRLCGRGPGLTPAGDDWLAGWLLGLRLTGDISAGETVCAAAEGGTTTFSRALLRCAADGQADEAWQRLLAALAQSDYTPGDVNAAALSILSHGATSGAAMLTGFVAGLDIC